MASTIPVLDVTGTPAQIGAAHGEGERERIRGCVERYVGWLASAAGLSDDGLWSKWAPQLAFNEQQSPDLVEEMRGISRGSGVPVERIFLLNSMLDMIGFRYPPMAQNFGCSTFVPPATRAER
jgi:isopenicillin-N N-acyltransferase-like protein